MEKLFIALLFTRWTADEPTLFWTHTMTNLLPDLHTKHHPPCSTYNQLLESTFCGFYRHFDFLTQSASLLSHSVFDWSLVPMLLPSLDHKETITSISVNTCSNWKSVGVVIYNLKFNKVRCSCFTCVLYNMNVFSRILWVVLLAN